MRAQFVHLSGPHRGRTETYRQRVVSVGTAPDAVARYPVSVEAVSRRHAEVEFVEEGCAFYLRAVDGPVFVNRAQVHEVILEHNDLIEFGMSGPKVRFRIYADKGTVCKPVRVMVEDARAVGRESGSIAGARSMTRDLLTQATTKLKIGFPLVVLGLVLLSGALAGWFGGRSSGGRAVPREIQQQIADLQQRLDAEREAAQAVSRTEINELRQELAARTADLDRMRDEDSALREIYDRLRLGVCLVHGMYGFRKNDEWLATRRNGRLQSEYTGSGFLVTKDGWIATNRHVAAPWTSDANQRKLLASGYEPRFMFLRVFFPGRGAMSVDVDVTRLRQDQLDVALIRVSALEVEGIPVLPLAAVVDEQGAVLPARAPGERVLVVGYPTGANALLAKADPAVVDRVTSGVGDLASVLDGLAGDNAISPLITRGSLSDVTPMRLVYDADTTSGGSGGPVFGRAGEVIGVNFAVVRDFTGSNLGVPVQYVHELLAPVIR